MKLNIIFHYSRFDSFQIGVFACTRNSAGVLLYMCMLLSIPHQKGFGAFAPCFIMPHGLGGICFPSGALANYRIIIVYIQERCIVHYTCVDITGIMWGSKAD